MIILTDPQVITYPYAFSLAFLTYVNWHSRDLGDIFTNGNVPSAFLSFCDDHVCNCFCHDFDLTPLDEFVQTLPPKRI
jgi:hypothetical protein